MKILIPVESANVAQAQVDFIINHKCPADLALQVLYAVVVRPAKKDSKAQTKRSKSTSGLVSTPTVG